MKQSLILGFFLIFLFACSENEGETAATEESTVTPALVLLDSTVADNAKKAMAAFEKGDMDGFTEQFADDVMYRFSSGDSLVGKQAVKDFYAGRWQVIQSVNFTENIYLPIQVNESQSQYAPTGKWLLQWAMVNATYKNGKNLQFWIHVDNHFNDAGKVDLVIQYIDMAPIMEATKDLMPQ